MTEVIPVTVDPERIADDACTHHGASQNRQELAMALREILAITPHKRICEIGCDAGGTLYAWTRVASKVYGITLADNGFESGGSGLPLTRHGAEVLVADSHKASSLAWLQRKLDGHKLDVLVIDGDHSVQGVYDDIAMYAPLVRRGGLVFLHDIAVKTDARAMIWKVWPEFRESSDFITDELVHMGHGQIGWGVIRVKGGEPWD